MTERGAKISATKRWFRDLTPEERRVAQEQRRKQRGQEWKERNRERTQQQSRSQYAEDPHKAKLNRIRWRFGLSPVQYLATIYFQDNRCRCCGTSDPGSVHGWHIDHDHETNRVRGAVCHRCNSVLGMLGDLLRIAKDRCAMFLRYLEVA